MITTAAVETSPRCGDCRHFQDAPAVLEASLPGFRSLGSAFGSVRATDGLCARHDRYLAAAFSCADHSPREP